MKPSDVLRKQIQYYSYAVSAILLIFYGKSIGNNGLAYFAMGIEVIAVFYMFIGDGVSEIYSKMLRFRRKRKQFYGAFGVKKRIAICQIIMGLVFCVLTLLFADKISLFLFHSENAAVLIRILSPLLIIRMLSSLYFGYFQSFGFQFPVMLVSFIRPLFFFVFGKIFCDKMLNYGEKVSALLKNDDFYGMYGAVGLTLGILISEIIIVLILAFFYLFNDRNYDKQKAKEGIMKSEPVMETLGNFAYQMTPTVFFGVVKRIMILMPFILLADNEIRGIYYGKYLVICCIPIFFVCARFAYIHSRIMGACRNRNIQLINEYIQVGLQYTWVVGLLVTALTAILAPQLVTAIWEQDSISVSILQKGAFLILPTLMIIFLALIHMTQNRRVECFLTLVVTTVLFVVASKIIYAKNTTLDGLLTAAVISLYIGMILMAIVTVFMYLRSLEYVPVFLMPLLCISISGVVIVLISKLLSPHIGNTLCFIICLVLGTVIYLGTLGIFRAFTEMEIEKIYGKLGKRILTIIFR